tara:strand:- start:16257 stop:16814 length:558 start_codon:yes stop_codon:yes gene_type:complete
MAGKPFIFGIGEGKTGTSSLRKALEMLGFTAYHCGATPKFKTKIEVNIANKKPLLDGIEKIDCLVEVPNFYKELDQQVANAKFILTYRNPDDAALSWVRMCSLRHTTMPQDWCDFLEYSERHRLHLTNVTQYFHGRPNKLLILDQKDTDATKWRLLSHFLKVDIDISTPFPHVFDHQKEEKGERF